MTTLRLFGFPVPRLTLVVALGALLATTSPVPTQAQPVFPTMPEGVTEISKEHLTSRVPNFFCFDYPFAPVPGKRLWMRVDDRHFIERYPDGTESRFLIFGHANVHDMEGTIVIKMAGDLDKSGASNDGDFQVFIPDKGNNEMTSLYRRVGSGPSEWLDNLRSLNRKNTLQKVE